MRWSDIPFAPPPKLLREFSALWIGFFGLIAARQWQLGRPTAAAVLGVAAILIGGLGLVRPNAVRPIFVGWMILAFPIGWTVSNLALAIVFLLMICPMSLAFRLLGRDALLLKRPPDASTYWRPRDRTTDVLRYFRQF